MDDKKWFWHVMGHYFHNGKKKGRGDFKCHIWLQTALNYTLIDILRIYVYMLSSGHKILYFLFKRQHPNKKRIRMLVECVYVFISMCTGVLELLRLRVGVILAWGHVTELLQEKPHSRCPRPSDERELKACRVACPSGHVARATADLGKASKRVREGGSEAGGRRRTQASLHNCASSPPPTHQNSTIHQH